MKKWKVRSALVALIVLLAVVPVMRSIITVHRVMSAPPGVGMCTQRFMAYLLNEPGAIRQR